MAVVSSNSEARSTKRGREKKKKKVDLPEKAKLSEKHLSTARLSPMSSPFLFDSAVHYR